MNMIRDNMQQIFSKFDHKGIDINGSYFFFYFKKIFCFCLDEGFGLFLENNPGGGGGL